jgi:hypothetical protein
MTATANNTQTVLTALDLSLLAMRREPSWLPNTTAATDVMLGP